ncbi:MAG: ADP-ribosylglycohydrolase family protein [Planctomycetota bacterium]
MFFTPDIRTLVKQEIKQREEEGCKVSQMRKTAQRLCDDGAPPEKFEKLYDEVEKLKAPKKYHEPSDLPAIRKARPKGPRKIEKVFSHSDLYDRIYGAWLGRSAGCLLGKPVEGATKEQIEIAAELSTGYPLQDYFGPIVNPPEKISSKKWGQRDWGPGNKCLKGAITAMARDDDMDYTILGLHIMEEVGLNFTPADMGRQWLMHFPYHLVYTAERVAYRNLVNGLQPPQTATYRNPCREWIGAQIRADAFGYVSPGMPERAAELAFNDAALSHTMNGIYGEMFVAAMIAAAFVSDDIEEIIRIGASEIPKKTRLTECIDDCLKWCRKDKSWTATIKRISKKYGDLQGCHTITNAAIVLMGLLHSKGDFEKGITIAVMGGFDTDCNGATVGSILGAMLGAKALPAKWIAPLNDTLESILVGFHVNKISDLAKRTLALAAKQIRGTA